VLGHRFDNASSDPVAAEFFADGSSAWPGELSIEPSDILLPLALLLNELGQLFGCVLRLLDLLNFRHGDISDRRGASCKVIACHSSQHVARQRLTSPRR